MKVYNTLGRELVDFVPLNPGEVGIYVCGPTVQSLPHLGHGRAAVVFDVITRYLRWRGYRVRFVRNITDIEDKIIAAAAEAGVSAQEHAASMTRRFEAAFTTLNVEEPDIEPKATDHVPAMIDLIERLVSRGLAYPADGDVYFRVRMLESYGRLSGRKPDELLAGARVEVSEAKADPLDFTLWKSAKPGEPYWASPWGPGRPGWHIECSAMAAQYLGEPFDIHGGGSDLIFPHHENEIAQSEGVSGKTFARYWLHNGMVNLGGEKMAKSTGHVVDLTEAINQFGPNAVRLFYLRAHYRSPLEFSEELLAENAAAFARVERFVERIDPAVAPDDDLLARFVSAMDEDFATPEAVSVVFDAVREGNRRLDAGGNADGLGAGVAEVIGVLGFSTGARGLGDLGEAVSALAAELSVPIGRPVDSLLDDILTLRNQARQQRDFAKADLIRDRLGLIGVAVEDTADGARWSRR